MKTKEKAEELIEKHKMQCRECGGNETAKIHALITVDEIIEALGRLNVEVLHTEYGSKLIEINGEIRTNYVSHVIYWNEVKNEIEKL